RGCGGRLGEPANRAAGVQSAGLVRSGYSPALSPRITRNARTDRSAYGTRIAAWPMTIPSAPRRGSARTDGADSNRDDRDHDCREPEQHGQRLERAAEAEEQRDDGGQSACERAETEANADASQPRYRRACRRYRRERRSARTRASGRSSVRGAWAANRRIA